MRFVHPINWIQWLSLAVALTVAVTTPILYLRVQHSLDEATQARIRIQQIQHRIQHVQHHQNDALRSIICRAEHVVRTQPDIPARQRREALHFYRHALAGAHLPPCS